MPRNASKVAIVGAGGTGCHIISILAKKSLDLKIIDRDVIEESNLNRQMLYSKKDIGKSKAVVAAKKAEGKAKITPIFDDLNPKNISKILQGINFLIDCTDNIDTRLLINDYCRKNNIPWIHTAAEGIVGECMLITKDSPCYSCVVGEKHGEGCDSIGVDLTVLKNTSAFAAKVVLEFLAREKNTESEKALYRFHGSSLPVSIAVKNDSNCNACNGKYDYLDERKRKIAKICGHNRFFFDVGRKLDLEEISKIMIGKKIKTKDSIITPDFTILRKGVVLVRAADDTDARKKIAKYLKF